MFAPGTLVKYNGKYPTLIGYKFEELKKAGYFRERFSETIDDLQTIEFTKDNQFKIMFVIKFIPSDPYRKGFYEVSFDNQVCCFCADELMEYSYGKI